MADTSITTLWPWKCVRCWRLGATALVAEAAAAIFSKAGVSAATGVMTHFLLWLAPMKQKIVIKVQVRCKKCWSKAMKIVSVEEGEIFSVTWEGEGKDKMVVIGDGVNAATLTTKLDKKLGCAELLLVEEVKGKKEEKKVVPKEEKKVKEPTPQCCQPYCPCKQQLCTQISYPFEYRLCGPVVYGYEDPCTSTCNIM